jgi:transposase
MDLQVVYPACAGLDVHKKTVVACTLTPAGRQTRTFRTWTGALRGMADWLGSQGVTHVVMEATGAYWKPVYNVLEERAGFTLVVANPERVRAIPGRKTDVKDAEWLATLLRHGLVAPSFIPSRDQRELRELTRYRTAKIQERAREVNRLQKTLEGANIKLAAVLTDVLGVSGQRILAALLHGEENAEALAALADYRVQAKRADLEAALVGRVSPTLRFVIREQLASIQTLDEQVARCDAEVERVAPFREDVARLRTVPGIGQRTAEVILAEIGTDMERFPTAAHLAAWGGMCPGNRESAGKRKPARTRKGSPWLRGALGEAAWAASRTKAGYLRALFHRLAGRRGRKRAVVAVGHALLVIVYHLLHDRTTYRDLGDAYFEERDRDAVKRRAVRQLERAGFSVQVELLPIAS